MESVNSLNNKTMVVTGASAGIGLASAIALTRLGATVIGVGRSEERCRKAEDTICAQVPGANILFLLADLSCMDQVWLLEGDIRRTLADLGAGHLDVLVNNAGTYVDKYTLTRDGLEMTMAVNHFAPFLLTNLLLDLFQNAGDGRVITISSDSHYRTWLDIDRLNHPLLYNGLWAYKCSKLANVLFTREFNRRYIANNVRAFAVDPGLVSTDIGFKQTGWLARKIWQMRKDAGVPAEVPAKTVVMLAGMPIDRQPDEDYWYDCQPKPASGQAMRSDLANRLWDESARLVHLDEGAGK